MALFGAFRSGPAGSHRLPVGQRRPPPGSTVGLAPDEDPDACRWIALRNQPRQVHIVAPSPARTVVSTPPTAMSSVCRPNAGVSPPS